MRTATGLPLNLSSPLSASSAASTITMATSLCLVPISLRLSTEPPVTRAVACIARHVFGQDVGHAAAERIVDAAGAAGGDGDVGLLLRQRRAPQRHSADAATPAHRSISLSAFHR